MDSNERACPACGKTFRVTPDNPQQDVCSRRCVRIMVLRGMYERARAKRQASIK